MKNFEIYRKWLLIDSILVVMVGLYIALFKESRIFLFDDFLDHYFWNGNQAVLDGTSKYISFIYSLLGAVMASWGVLMCFIVKYPFSNKEKWAWQALIVCILVWFPIDEFFSLYHGVYFNAIFNIPFLLLLLIPLLLSGKAFSK